MDTTLFLFIHGFARHWILLDDSGIFFAKYAIYFFAPLIAVLVWYRRRAIGDIVIALALAMGINQLIGHFFFRPRPFVALHTTPLIDLVSVGKSFPSDHTAVSFALAAVFAAAYPRWQFVAYGFALCIGLARIFAGVHYPGDILGGIVVGLVAGYGARAYLSFFAYIRSRYYGSK